MTLRQVLQMAEQIWKSAGEAADAGTAAAPPLLHLPPPARHGVAHEPPTPDLRVQSDELRVTEPRGFSHFFLRLFAGLPHGGGGGIAGGEERQRDRDRQR